MDAKNNVAVLPELPALHGMDSFEVFVVSRRESEPFLIGDQVYLVTDVEGPALEFIRAAVGGRYERLANGHFKRVCETPPDTKPRPR